MLTTEGLKVNWRVERRAIIMYNSVQRYQQDFCKGRDNCRDRMDGHGLLVTVLEVAEQSKDIEEKVDEVEIQADSAHDVLIG